MSGNPKGGDDSQSEKGTGGELSRREFLGGAGATPVVAATAPKLGAQSFAEGSAAEAPAAGPRTAIRVVVLRGATDSSRLRDDPTEHRSRGPRGPRSRERGVLASDRTVEPHGRSTVGGELYSDSLASRKSSGTVQPLPRTRQETTGSESAR